MVKVHFLNVGHGDCTIIEHASGRISMVDINNADDVDVDTARAIAKLTPNRLDDIKIEVNELFRRKRRLEILKEDGGYDVELTNPVVYYLHHFGTRPIFRYIQTHPHLDHMRGLTSLRAAGIRIHNLWDTSHTFTPEFSREGDEAEWAEYKTLRSGRREGVTVLRLNQGDAKPYFNKDDPPFVNGDSLYILAPIPEINESINASDNPNINDLSYVLWFEHKGIKFVLGGDAETQVWDALYDKYGTRLSCHVLKASHHGRDSAYHQKAVEAMSPVYTIVSVGKKPSTDASNKYRSYSPNVWSTRWRGNIVVTVRDDGTYTIDSQYDR